MHLFMFHLMYPHCSSSEYGKCSATHLAGNFR